MTQFKILPSSPLVVIFGTNGILMWQSEKITIKSFTVLHFLQVSIFRH